MAVASTVNRNGANIMPQAALPFHCICGKRGITTRCVQSKCWSGDFLSGRCLKVCVDLEPANQTSLRLLYAFL